MYLLHTKTALIEALRRTFDDDYHIPELRNLWVSMEYPIERSQYPGIWADYEDAGSLQTVGISHVEDQLDEEGEPTGYEYMRWRFQGYAQFTITALTSFERDRIYDELIRVLAFGREREATSVFRNHIEGNDLVALMVDFDTIEPRGTAAAPGTPWETDELIYERSIGVQVIGEFVSDPYTYDLVNLSKIVWQGYYEDDDRDVVPPRIQGEYPPGP